MRSGGVVGLVQEKAACYRKPSPIRHPQPLSQGLSALPAPLFDRGRFCGNAGRHRTPQKRRFCGDPENSIDFRQVNCRKSDAGTRRRGPRAICPAPRERCNAAGSRFFRRLRRSNAKGPRKTCFAGKSSAPAGAEIPQRFAAGRSFTFHRRKVDRKAAGGPLYQRRNAPRTPRSLAQKTLSKRLYPSPLAPSDEGAVAAGD